MTNRFKFGSCCKKLEKVSLLSLASFALMINGVSYANEYVDKAKVYISKNKPESAVIELKNAIQSSPENALPRLMLGEIYLNNGSFIAAEKELSRALELGASEDNVVPLLARSLSAQAKSLEVIELANRSNLTEPYAKTDLLALKAAAELLVGLIDEAKYSLELAKEYSYDSLYLQLSVAKLDAVNNDVDAALQSVDKILETVTDNSDVWLLKGHLETGAKNFPEATKSYQKAYEISADAIYYTLFIANSMVREKRFEDAEKYIDNLLSLAPNHLLANKLKAVIVYNRKDYSIAKRHANKVLQSGQNDVTLELISAASSFELKLFEQAYKMLKRVEPKVPDNQNVKQLLISTQLALGYIDEAVEAMNAYSVETESDGAFLSIASMRLSELGREEEALNLAQRASLSGSTSSELMLSLIQLSADDSTGIENLQSAIKDQPDAQKAQLGAAQYYVRYGFDDEAKEIIEKLLIANPKDVGAIILQGQILQKEQNFASARKEYIKALSIEENNVKALVALAQVNANLQQWQQAYELSSQAFKLAPNDKSVGQITLLSGSRLGRLPEILELINSELNKTPEELELLYTKAKALVLSNRISEGINLLESLPDTKKTGETWQLIGNFYYQEQKWYDADKAWANWLELSPLSVEAYVRNIHIKEKTRKIGAGSKLAEKAEKLFPGDVRFTLMRAVFAFNAGDMDSSQTLLNSLGDEVIKTPIGLKLRGLLSIANEEYATAVEVYEKRYAITPGIKGAMELSSVYVLNNQLDEAITFLSEVIEANPEQGKPLEIKLASLMTSKNPTDAINKYQLIVTQEPTNFLALNNLAWLYLEENKLEEAQLYAEQAYQHGGVHPQIADTYGYVLLKSGNNEKALEVLEDAYSKMADNPEVGLHYAESLILNNKADLAKTVLEKVITEDPKLTQLKGELERKIVN